MPQPPPRRLSPPPPSPKIPPAPPPPRFSKSDFPDSLIGGPDRVLDRVEVTSSVPVNPVPLRPTPPMLDPFPAKESPTAETNERVSRYRMLVPICDELDSLNMELFVQFGHLLISAQNKRGR